MKFPDEIHESDEAIAFLEKRSLIKQYQRAKHFLLNHRKGSTDFKERHPKGNNFRSFRINQQYRALGYFDHNDFVVTMIDDHQ